jgi:hypothetical protein
MLKISKPKNNKIKEIKAMLKLIPNGVIVSAEDLKEIYSQDDKRI